MRRSNLSCLRLCVTALVALSASLLAPASQAQLQEAQALLQQGQRSQALDKVERALATNPKDRQARFLKGVILAEMNKLDDAASVFVKLTEEAPELPEPYNNLAVIYAQQKQFDKARAALEMAIRTHPSYAVAHENLGDLYAKMARQAYDRALQIDSNNSNAQAKLNLLRDLTATGAPPTAPSKPITITAASSSAALAVAAAAAKPMAPAATASASSASAPAAKPVPATATASNASPDEAKKAVRSALQEWASAWSKKNAKEYLSFYAKDFQVPDNKPRKDWEEERTDRVSKPGNIKVTLSEFDIKIDGTTATAHLKQRYESSTFKANSGKTFDMVLRNGRWQIKEERIGR